MVKFTLRQLEYFRAAVRTGGIAQAARSLNVSNAAVASAIGKLEDITGLILFDRFPAYGLRLTATGQRFLRDASALLEQSEKLELLAQRLRSDRSGHVRLGTYFALAHQIALPLVLQHKTEWPDVKIEVVEADYKSLIQQLADGALDMVLVYDQDTDLTRFHVETLMSIAPRALLPGAHALANQSAVSLRDLEGIPYLSVHVTDPGPSYLDMLNRAGLHPPTGLETHSYEMVRSYVGKGLGFTMIAFQPENPRTYFNDPVTLLPVIEDIGTISVLLITRRGTQSAILDGVHELCKRIVQGAAHPAPHPVHSR